MALRLLNCPAVSGVIGKISFDRSETLARPALDLMLDALQHRGGGCSIFAAPGVALGCRIEAELSDDASGVAAALDQRIRVVADSQLTNRPELAAALTRLGRTPAGGTDAEIIAHAYEAWGDRCVERFRGPFACAIWDAPRDRLLLARDPLGIRPLYFAFLHGHGIVFATEIRALLMDPGVGREWSAAAIDAYLALGYVPAPLTAYQRVSKLEPGHRLVVEGRRCRMEQYWDLPLPEVLSDSSADAVPERLEGLLRAAVDRELAEADVEGTLYSGGTASSALLASHAQNGRSAILVGLDDAAAQIERSHAAACRLGWEPQVEVAIPDVAVVATGLAARFDEPIADPAAISHYAVCVAARLHARCALSAHGAAALWAGYERHRVERIENAARVWLGPLARLGHAAHAFQDSIKGARALSHLTLPPAAACATKHAYGLWEDEYRRGLYTRDFAWQVRDSDPFVRHLALYLSRETGDALDRALYVDARTCLPDNLLTIAEGAANAAGMSLRMPYLDLDLAEFAARVPSTLKQSGPAVMQPIRALLERRLPPALMPPARRSPQSHPWLQDAVAAMVPKVLLAERFDGRGIVSRPALRHFWDEHCAGARDHAHRLWSLLMLEFWFREFIDGDASEEPLEYAVVKAA